MTNSHSKLTNSQPSIPAHFAVNIPFYSDLLLLNFLIYSALFTLFSEIYLSNLSNSDNSFWSVAYCDTFTL